MEEATRRRVTPTLLLALVVLAASVPAGFCAINSQDGSALNALKSGWTNAPSSWSSATDPCDGGWDGVMCNNGRVTSLRLSSVNIQGTLSDSIGQLTQLVYLLFDSNQLTGPIPEEIGDVSTLQVLRLDRNSLRGAIPPNISNLVNLNELNLASNQLTGSLPDLSRMTQLNIVDLSNNCLEELS